jgi:hypothetical protein
MIKGSGYLQVLLISSIETPDGFVHLVCVNRQTLAIHTKLPADELKDVLRKLRYTKDQQRISKWDIVTHIWQTEHDGLFLTIFCSNGLYHMVDCLDPLFKIKPVYHPVPQPAESDLESEETSEIPTETIDPDPDDQTPLISIAEAATLLHISERTVRRRCDSGAIQGEQGADGKLYVRISAGTVE